MKDRIELIFKEFRLSSAQFADSIGVQRSSISHILSGRNKPSYDFIHKILLKYPNINANWLITGQGDMLYTHSAKLPEESTDLASDLFSEPLKNSSFPLKNKERTPLVEPSNTKQKEAEKVETLSDVTNVNSVKNIILMYDDDTFKILNSR